MKKALITKTLGVIIVVSFLQIGCGNNSNKQKVDTETIKPECVIFHYQQISKCLL